MFKDLPKQTLEVQRVLGSYVNGLWIESGTSNEIFFIEASIQEQTIENSQFLPEGNTTKASYTLLTETKLKTAEIGNSKADVVIINGERCQVVKVAAWQDLQFPVTPSYYEVLVIRENIDR